MSSNYLRLIPSDPNFIPEEQAHIQARAMFETFVSKAYEISSRVYENVIFIIEAIDPDTDIEKTQINELEHILQCTLRKIWAHY